MTPHFSSSPPFRLGGGGGRRTRQARANVKTEHRQTTSQWLLLPFPRPPLHFDRTRVNPLLPETDILQQGVAKGFHLWEIVPERDIIYQQFYATLCQFSFSEMKKILKKAYIVRDGIS